MATWAGHNTYDNSYDTGTLKYDVSEAIWRITPDDTPFYNMIGDTVATATLHEWLEEELTVRSDNAVLEGAAWGDFTEPVSQERVQNRVQTLKTTVSVTRMMQRVRQWGISDMFGSNMLKRMREWKTDAEHALIRGSGDAAASAGVAGRMDGVLWALTGVGGVDAVTVKAAAATTFNEEQFNDMHERAWNLGGFPEDCLVGSLMKRRISSFQSSADNSYFNVDNTKIRNTISVYESDFTTVQVHLSRDMRNTAESDAADVLLVTAPMFKKAWIDKPFAQRTPPTGDAMYGVILGDLTLETGARKAHQVFIGTN